MLTYSKCENTSTKFNVINVHSPVTLKMEQNHPMRRERPTEVIIRQSWKELASMVSEER